MTLVFENSDDLDNIREIGTNFFNLRVLFQLGGQEVGNHMSMIKLQNGKYLIIDAVEMSAAVKRKFDRLTGNGSKIEAVLAVYPFHTLAFPNFYKNYPNLKYYGTPRHLRNVKEVKWTGVLTDKDPSTLLQWEPEVKLRIPEGEIRSAIHRFLRRNDFRFSQELNSKTLSQRRPIIWPASSFTIPSRKPCTLTTPCRTWPIQPD